MSTPAARSAAAGDLARVCRLLGEESRAAMCLAMLDGRAWTVSELAAEAGVGKAAASEHVGRLVDGGLVVTELQGRCRYVRLAGPDVATLVESASVLAGREDGGSRGSPGSLAEERRRRRFAVARTCYDHLAGRLGVAVYDGLVAGRLLSTRNGVALTRRGAVWFAELGLDVPALDRARRPLVRGCIDVTERRPHLAGALGAALCETFLDRDWVRRPDRTRALVVTPAGERTLESLLAITPATLTPA
jgi:DNA-binding transcriptional ArsR family regulator